MSDPAETPEPADAVEVELLLVLVLLLALVTLFDIAVELEGVVVFGELMLLVLLFAFSVLIEALVALLLLVDVPVAPSSKQLLDDEVVVWSEDAVFVSLAACAAISVSVMTFTEIVGLPVALPTEAVLV